MGDAAIDQKNWRWNSYLATPHDNESAVKEGTVKGIMIYSDYQGRIVWLAEF